MDTSETPGFGGLQSLVGICLCKSDQKRQQDVANSYIEAVVPGDFTGSSFLAASRQVKEERFWSGSVLEIFWQWLPTSLNINHASSWPQGFVWGTLDKAHCIKHGSTSCSFFKKRIEKRWIFSVSLILSSFSINAFYTQQISTLQNFLEHFQNSSYSSSKWCYKNTTRHMTCTFHATFNTCYLWSRLPQLSARTHCQVVFLAGDEHTNKWTPMERNRNKP